jgi:predicted ArsR family transcriptional regulator
MVDRRERILAHLREHGASHARAISAAIRDNPDWTARELQLLKRDGLIRVAATSKADGWFFGLTK